MNKKEEALELAEKEKKTNRQNKSYSCDLLRH